MSETPVHHDCRVFGHFKRIERPIPFSAFPVESYNHICDVLESLSGVGCRIEKQSPKNPNWIITCDNGMLDWNPELFRLAWSEDKLCAYLPTQNSVSTSDYVTLNGAPVEFDDATCALRESAGNPDYREIFDADDVEGKLVVVRIVNGTDSHSPLWYFKAVDDIGDEDDPDEAAAGFFDVPIGSVSDKRALRQVHIGKIEHAQIFDSPPIFTVKVVGLNAYVWLPTLSGIVYVNGTPAVLNTTLSGSGWELVTSADLRDSETVFLLLSFDDTSVGSGGDLIVTMDISTASSGADTAVPLATLLPDGVVKQVHVGCVFTNYGFSGRMGRLKTPFFFEANQTSGAPELKGYETPLLYQNGVVLKALQDEKKKLIDIKSCAEAASSSSSGG